VTTLDTAPPGPGGPGGGSSEPRAIEPDTTTAHDPEAQQLRAPSIPESMHHDPSLSMVQCIMDSPIPCIHGAMNPWCDNVTNNAEH